MRSAEMNDGALTSCLLAALMVAFSLMSGCLVVSGDEPGNTGEGDCWTDCKTVEVCETYCDDTSCQEECRDEQSCETVCDSEPHFEDESEFFNEPETCYSDLECSEGRICIDNECTPADTDEGGSAGLCQTCETTSDCIEDGALCLGFLADEDDEEPAETVCGRVCESEGDCPTGFECLTVDEDASDQCVPVREGEERRTCSAGEDLECVVADDCATGERCLDNECHPPEDAECEDDNGCGAGEVCEVFQCVDEEDSSQCLTADDCSGDEVCVDGQCKSEAESCVFNADCGSDERCVDGQCTPTCDGDGDCGSNERCREGICEYIECYNSSDCSPGEACVEATCEETCDSDDDCSEGYLCADLGYCEPDPDVECRSSAECGTDEACNDDLECEPTCTCNDDCGSGEICSEESTLCVDEGSTDAEGLQCE